MSQSVAVLAAQQAIMTGHTSDFYIFIYLFFHVLAFACICLISFDVPSASLIC